MSRTGIPKHSRLRLIVVNPIPSWYLYKEETREAAISSIFGNLKGLKPEQIKKLKHLYRRRLQPGRAVTPEFARAMAEVSFDTGRQVGILLDRRGHIDFVMVGTDSSILLPDFGRLRAAKGRLRGLTYVHTHLDDSPLSREDLVDLAKLRFDLVAAIQVDRKGRPGLVHAAHLLPENSETRLWRELESVDVHKFDLDMQALVKALEEEMARSGATGAELNAGSRAVVVCVHSGARFEARSRLDELVGLVRSAGLDVVETHLQHRSRPDPNFLVGRGKLESIVLDALYRDADTLVVDPDLSPTQAASIAGFTELKVLDRTQVILDIFAQRAQSREGKLQVELAQLKYLMPRLSARDSGLSRLTGGIGGRGPGETKLEIDRRRAKDRIRKLEKRIDALSRERELKRSKRKRAGLGIVSLVGYTNAGKSTLLNALTRSSVLVEDKLFATLDPVSRRLDLGPGVHALLTDTVGFIRDLPEELAKAFRATLEELGEADLLVHVADASDPELEVKLDSVNKILAQMGLNHLPVLLVLNKCDLIPLSEQENIGRLYRGIPVSASKRLGLDMLLSEIRLKLMEGSRRDGARRTGEPADLTRKP